MLGWDEKGHALSWSFRVPAAGKYRLTMLRASARLAERKLTVAGKEYGIFAFPADRRLRPLAGGVGAGGI